jgi:AcrR family transcriptional regulator
MSGDQSEPATEGWRARKRRMTRQRIAETAMAMFLDQGFEATTVDDIAAAAGVSKRTFFDYFPAKDAVLFAWQEASGEALATAIANRPASEPLAICVREALIASVAAAADPRAIAIDKLVRQTPALAARTPLKYAKLEGMVAEALAKREGLTEPDTRIRVLAMVTIGSLKLGSENWRAGDRQEDPQSHVRRFIHQVWSELQTLSEAVLKEKEPPAPV